MIDKCEEDMLTFKKLRNYVVSQTLISCVLFANKKHSDTQVFQKEDMLTKNSVKYRHEKKLKKKRIVVYSIFVS